MKLVLAVSYIFVIRIFIKLDKKMENNSIWKYMNSLNENWRYYAIGVIFIIINMLFL